MPRVQIAARYGAGHTMLATKTQDPLRSFRGTVGFPHYLQKRKATDLATLWVAASPAAHYIRHMIMAV